MWVGRGYLDRKDMTLWSLGMYGNIGNKTKSYQILRKFLLLFIFHAFWPYKTGLPCFLVRWPYKAGFPCFLALQPFKAGFPCFMICFPFCSELLGFCPRADRVRTILWIITECLALNLAASDFSCSDWINHPTRFMRKTLWRCRYPRVPYLLLEAVQSVTSKL